MHLYSPEWIASFNEAMGDLPADPGLSFSMLQIVRDAPEDIAGPSDPGDQASSGRVLELMLHAEDGRLHLGRLEAGGPAPDVAVSLSYQDALALATGETDPASLIAAGHVRVRGDLSVLVRASALMVEAARRIAGSLEPAGDDPPR